MARLLPVQQAKSHLGQGVGLGEHRNTRLHLDLVAHEVRHFARDVHVGYLRFRRAHVLGLDAQVGDGVLKTVLQGAKVSTDIVLGDDRLLDPFQRALGGSLRGDRVGGGATYSRRT